ncbi:MAG: acylphosphatase [Alphaproteobacteria bacterium]|nr:acylphosphatase [Alphaproteobacteria bacterium]
MASNNTVTKHLRIYGRVQGVSYRYWTQTTAHGLDLSGWVRNCNDGSVEAMVHGPEKTVQDLITACNDGPPMAEVEKIDVKDSADDEWFDGFEIKPTV